MYAATGSDFRPGNEAQDFRRIVRRRRAEAVIPLRPQTSDGGSGAIFPMQDDAVGNRQPFLPVKQYFVVILDDTRLVGSAVGNRAAAGASARLLETFVPLVHLGIDLLAQGRRGECRRRRQQAATDEQASDYHAGVSLRVRHLTADFATVAPFGIGTAPNPAQSHG